MAYPSDARAFEQYHRKRVSDIWQDETLIKVSGSHWDDDHLHAFRVLLKDNQKTVRRFPDFYDEASNVVSGRAGVILQEHSYRELRRMPPHRIRKLGPAQDFFRALVHALQRIPSLADTDAAKSDRGLRRVVKAVKHHNFSNLTDEEFEDMIATQHLGAADRRAISPQKDADLPRLAGGDANPPRSLDGYLSSYDTADKSKSQVSQQGQKRRHEPSSSDAGSSYSGSAASSNKSAHDARVKHEGVSAHVAIHFAQLVIDSAYGDSDTVTFDVTTHLERFDTSFGHLTWRCINDGCALLNGDVNGEWDVLSPIVFVSFELKSHSQDDPQGEGLRDKTESERLGQQVSELLGMLGQRLQLLGITHGCENLEAKIANLPEHLRT
jgi:hypothetical protein